MRKLSITLGSLFLLILHAGCATGLRAAYGTLDSAERVVSTAARELPAFDSAHQGEIVAKAGSLEAGQVELAKWRGQREMLVKAIEGAHASVRLARDAIADSVAAGKKDGDVSRWLPPAINGVKNLIELLHVVGVRLGINFNGMVL